MAQLDIFGKFNDEFKGLQNGFIDEVRFTNALRFTPGVDFTPPTTSAICGAIFDDGTIGCQDEVPIDEQLPGKTPTTSIFQRLGYDYSGSGVIEFSDNVLKTMNTAPSLLPEWAYEDMRTNNVGEYVKNPAASLIQTIQSICSPQLGSISVANTLWHTANTFKEHTDRLSGVVEIDPEKSDLPHYSTAVGTGKTLTYLVQQGDGYANSACILGNFTSILCIPEIEQMVSTLSLSSEESMIQLTNFLDERRIHDEQFFLNSRAVMKDYDQTKKFARMGETETVLVNNYLASDRLRSRGNGEFLPINSGCNTSDQGGTIDQEITVDTQCSPDTPNPSIVCSTKEVNQLVVQDDKTEYNIVQLKDGQTASIEFSSSKFTDFGILYGTKFSSRGVLGSTTSNGLEFVISRCKGEFDVVPPGNESRPENCRIKGSILQLETNSDSNPTINQCRLEPGEKYYLNIRMYDFSGVNNGKGCNAQDGCGIGVNVVPFEVPKTTACSIGTVNQRIDIASVDSSGQLRITSGNLTNLGKQEVASIAFRSTYTSSGVTKGISSFVLNNSSAGSGFSGAQIYISECSGNFDTVPPGNESSPNSCRLYFEGDSGTIRFGDGQNQCKLQNDKFYFVNIRWLNPTNSAVMCSLDTGCSASFSAAYERNMGVSSGGSNGSGGRGDGLSASS